MLSLKKFFLLWFFARLLGLIASWIFRRKEMINHLNQLIRGFKALYRWMSTWNWTEFFDLTLRIIVDLLTWVGFAALWIFLALILVYSFTKLIFRILNARVGVRNSMIFLRLDYYGFKRWQNEVKLSSTVQRLSKFCDLVCRYSGLRATRRFFFNTASYLFSQVGTSVVFEKIYNNKEFVVMVAMRATFCWRFNFTLLIESPAPGKYVHYFSRKESVTGPSDCFCLNLQPFNFVWRIFTSIRFCVAWAWTGIIWSGLRVFGVTALRQPPVITGGPFLDDSGVAAPEDPAPYFWFRTEYGQSMRAALNAHQRPPAPVVLEWKPLKYQSNRVLDPRDKLLFEKLGVNFDKFGKQNSMKGGEYLIWQFDPHGEFTDYDRYMNRFVCVCMTGFVVVTLYSYYYLLSDPAVIAGYLEFCKQLSEWMFGSGGDDKGGGGGGGGGGP